MKKNIIVVVICMLVLIGCGNNRTMSEREKEYSIWEIVEDRRFIATERMVVPGGWVVRTRTTDGVSMVFISDIKHEWKIGG